MPASPEHSVRVEKHVIVNCPSIHAVDLLHQETTLPKQRIKLAMQSGAVWLTRNRKTQRLRRAKRALQVGDEVHLYYDASILAEEPVAPELVADLGGYTVWNKPYGLRAQGSKWGDHCTVVRWAERHLQPERSAFTVHRLDRAANGLMLLAHSKTMAASLSILFRERQIKKSYRALVAGDFSTHAHPIRVDKEIDGKEAISTMSFIELRNGGAQSLVDVAIETGRKHQIRRHLADIGYPIVGDRLYGSGEADGVDLQLTASQLAFQCPIRGERVEFRLAGES